MALPITDLSYTPSVISQRVLPPQSGLDSARPSPTPRAPSPAHRVTSDSLDTGAAFAPVTEELSFAPPRAPSPVSSLNVLSKEGHPGLSLPLPESPSCEVSNSDGAGLPLVCATRVESSAVAGVITKTPLPPLGEKKDPLLSKSEAPHFLATLCDRISSFITEGVTRFVNWIASWFYSSSDEEDSKSHGDSITGSQAATSGVIETALAARSESPHDLGALHSAILQGVEELRSESPRTQDFSVDEAPSK